MAAKYKVGERIIYKREIWMISEIDNAKSDTLPTEYFIVFRDGGAGVYVFEYEIVSLKEFDKKCQCGSHHTSVPSWHMTFCPLFGGR